MAHPVRLDLMELLGREGELTATECAERLGQSPANCSFHLRQLARHGFVVEAGPARGRRRPWRLASVSHRWEPGPHASPAERAAGEALAEILVDRELEHLRAWQHGTDAQPPDWQDAAFVSQLAGYLTPSELAEFSERLVAWFTPFIARLSDAASRPEGARFVTGVAFAQPRVDEEVATPGEAGDA